MAEQSPWPTPKPVPAAEPVEFAPGLTYADPLSRKGTGPGLFVLVDDSASGLKIDNGIPSAFMKWAEEGYCVIEVAQKAFQSSADPLVAAVQRFESAANVEAKGTYGLVCYSPSVWELVAPTLDNHTQTLVGAVVYGSTTGKKPASTKIPTLQHLAGNSSVNKVQTTSQLQVYHYDTRTNASFATPHHSDYDYATEAVSHTRNLTFLKKRMSGPYFDLEDLWDEHTFYEFANRSVENTMNTMVQEPYVNHIPTITGGIGRKNLTDFYTNHFIFSNPDDAELELISRTVGIDRVVDEFVYKCTHDKTIDWLLPGVPPTGIKLEVSMLAIVNLRGDRLYHEHIHWDQATLLKQIGALPEYLPLNSPSSKTNGVDGVNGHRSLEIQLPVAGPEAVAKLREKNSVPSNEMFGYKARGS